MENKKANWNPSELEEKKTENQTENNRLQTTPGYASPEDKESGNYGGIQKPNAEETVRQSKEAQDLSNAEQRRDIEKAK